MRINLHRHKNLLTGFFVASCLVVFGVALLLLFQKKGVFERRYTILAVFDSGIGLRQGTDVLLNGVHIGQVGNINLYRDPASGTSSGRVVLELIIEKRFQEYITDRSAAFALRDKNLVSDRVINIESLSPGGRILGDGDRIMVSHSRDIESVLTGLTDLMGKTDQLLASIGRVVAMSQDSSSTIGAMLGSRALYDRFFVSLDRLDTVMSQGNDMLAGIHRLEKTVSASAGPMLANADSAIRALQNASIQAEILSINANHLAERGETLLDRVDGILLDGAGKVDQAGELMDAVSQLWFIRGKMRPEVKAYPLLLQEMGP